MRLDEAQFRALLDDRGVLRPGALPPPDRSAAYTVFAQRDDASLELGAMKSHASRFFGAKVGLTVDKRAGASAPAVDAARVVVSTADPATSGTRLCYGRPATEADRVAAETAERAQRTSGMSLLARRCRTVWLVELEADDDRVSLLLAAIFASVLLGPILTPAGDELFGVRTARAKLEAPR